MNSVAFKTTSTLPVLDHANDDGVFAQMGALRFDIIRDEASFMELAPLWDTLLEQSAARSPFLRWDWVSLWWAEYRDTFDLAIGVVRNVWHQPVAIAPLVIGRDDSGAQRFVRQLAFIGGIGDIASQILDFIIPRGQEAVLAPMLCRIFNSIRSHWDMVRFSGIHEDSPNLPFILEALQKCSHGAGVLNRHPSRFVKLPESWLEYEMTHSGSWRSKMRRKWKAMEQEQKGRTLLAGMDDMSDEAMQTLATLHANRFPEGVSEFLGERSQRFHRRLAERWIPQGRVVLPSIEIGGKTAAMMHGFIEGDLFFQYQMGWDPQFADISIGALVMAWSMKCAMARGVRHYDTLPGEFNYKCQWCPGVRHTVDIEAFNLRSVSGTIFRGLRAVKRLTSGVEKNNGELETQTNES